MSDKVVALRGDHLYIFVVLSKKCLTIGYQYIIIKTVKRDMNLTNIGQARKENFMDEDMNVGELLKETAEENQTRKILEILNESKDLAEAKERVKALLNK